MTKTKILKNIFLYLAIFFFLFFIANVILSKYSYIFNFDAWTVVPAPIMLFSFGGLNLFIYLMMIAKQVYLKVLFVSIAIFSLILISVILIFGAESYNVVKSEGYTIYVEEYRFLFGGQDNFYLKENFLVAKLIGSGDQSEEGSTVYYVENGYFYIIESWENGDTETTIIKLE
jgi:hypothetical protein